MIQTMHVQLADTGVLGQLDKILWVVLGLLHALEVPVSVSCVLLGQRLEVKAVAEAGLRQYNPVVHGVERGGNSGGASLLLLGVSARLLGLVEAGRLMKEFSAPWPACRGPGMHCWYLCWAGSAAWGRCPWRRCYRCALLGREVGVRQELITGIEYL